MTTKQTNTAKEEKNSIRSEEELIAENRKELTAKGMKKNKDEVVAVN